MAELGEANARCAEVVRVWWLHQVEGRWKEEAEWFGKCWVEAFEKAEAELARMKEAKGYARGGCEVPGGFAKDLGDAIEAREVGKTF